MNCLSKIFSAEGLLQTKDGLTINKPELFYLDGTPDPEALRLLVDLTARLGTEQAGMQLPLTGGQKENALFVRLSEEKSAGECSIGLEDGGICVCGGSWAELESGISYLTGCYPFDGRGKCLDDYLSEEGFQCIEAMVIDTDSQCIKSIAGKSGGNSAVLGLSGEPQDTWGTSESYDRAKEHFRQNLNVRILVDKIAAENPEAVLCTALRLAMENYETVFPYAVEGPREGCQNVRFMRETEKEWISFDDDGMVFHGDGQGLKELAYAYSAEEAEMSSYPVVKELEDILSCRNEVGQALEALCCWKGRKKQPLTLVTREYAKGMVSRQNLQHYLSEELGEVQLKNFNDEKEIYHDFYQCSWEGKDFMEKFYEEVMPLVKAGDRVNIYGRLSEDRDLRRTLEKEIESALMKKGAASGKAEILSSYKSGYSWIEERVIPGLKCEGLKGKISSILISFPYLLNERGDDTFEDESTPNYGMHLDNPLKFFDIPTRWLQELFPVDELLARELEIPKEAVTFCRDDEQPHTYVISCRDQSGGEVYRDSFDVKYIQKKYIERYPQIGSTHVTTGWIRAEINDETAVEAQLKTDPEKVWNVLEDEIIPKLETYLIDRYGIDGLVKAQPLFNRLQINIVMSEMDLDLGFRQERISTVEAMQEDIYFYLLDWFKTYGERECGFELNNIGLIMPEPEIGMGEDTQIEVILYDDLASGAELRCGEETVLLQEKNVELQVSEAAFRGETLWLRLVTEDFQAAEKMKLLGKMIEAGIIDFYQQRPLYVTIEANGREVQIFIPKRRPEKPSLTEDEKNALLSENVVDYEQYLDLLRYFEGEENVRIEPVETTYKGRKIFSISCVRRSPGVCYSENKLKSERISAAFTARHHGNEASSLNSTFRLLSRLLSDLSPMLDRVNFVLVPFINIDGGMLHCEVQRKHPKWLCHPARYNSAGFEFRKDFNKPDSIYGEARLLGKLWKRYLFDVITDNHGFEGHELCQPFSGYISPWYKSFWIPRALYYGYIWYDGEAPHMVEIGNRIRRKVSDAINSDEEIHGLNLEFAERFYKYAEKWFPELFKLERFEEVVFYWINTRERPRASNYGVSNPEITAIDWTTEVADETAVGDFMETNVRAHHISDLALLQVLDECELQVDTAVASEEKGHRFVKFRRHPLFSS